MIINQPKKRVTGSRGGELPLITLKIPRALHKKIAVFAAKHGCNLREAIAIKFSSK